MWIDCPGWWRVVEGGGLMASPKAWIEAWPGSIGWRGKGFTKSPQTWHYLRQHQITSHYIECDKDPGMYRTRTRLPPNASVSGQYKFIKPCHASCGLYLCDHCHRTRTNVFLFLHPSILQAPILCIWHCAAPPVCAVNQFYVQLWRQLAAKGCTASRPLLTRIKNFIAICIAPPCLTL